MLDFPDVEAIWNRFEFSPQWRKDIEVELAGFYNGRSIVRKHCIITGIYAAAIVPEHSFADQVVFAAFLHDIGKEGFPCDFFEERTLTLAERPLVETHPLIGYRMLFDRYRLVAGMVGEHHRKNGNGYGLLHTELDNYSSHEREIIAQGAQCIAIADVFDSLGRRDRGPPTTQVDEMKRKVQEETNALPSHVAAAFPSLLAAREHLQRTNAKR